MNKPKFPNKRLVLVASVILCLGLIAGALVTQALTPSQTFYISPGIYPGAPSYTVWVESATYFAKDSFGHQVYDGSSMVDLFNAILIENGTRVFARNGIYEISTTVQLDTYQGLSIEGESMSHTIFKAASQDLTVFNVTQSYVQFRNLKIGQANGINDTIGINFCGYALNGIYNNLIERVCFYNFNGTGSIGVRLETTYTTTISKCQFWSSDGKGLLLDNSTGLDSTSCYVHDCIFLSQYDAWIEMWEGAGSVIRSCYFEGTTNKGVFIYYIGINFEDNFFDQPSTLATNELQVINSFGQNPNVIRGNHFYNASKVKIGYSNVRSGNSFNTYRDMDMGTRTLDSSTIVDAAFQCDTPSYIDVTFVTLQVQLGESQYPPKYTMTGNWITINMTETSPIGYVINWAAYFVPCFNSTSQTWDYHPTRYMTYG